jgi:DNA-binding Lrp family transcriptional regulator
MSQQERDSHGRYTPDHADADVLAAVREHAPAATSEVANELGIARQSADYRLRRLADAGRVNRKKIAATLVWTPAEEGENA